jgi:hypothetical protein
MYESIILRLYRESATLSRSEIAQSLCEERPELDYSTALGHVDRVLGIQAYFSYPKREY